MTVTMHTRKNAPMTRDVFVYQRGERKVEIYQLSNGLHRVWNYRTGEWVGDPVPPLTAQLKAFEALGATEFTE